MTDVQKRIADKVRGVAAENRTTQQHIADLLGIDRKSVNARMQGMVPFSGVELWQLTAELNVDITAFFPAVRLATTPSIAAAQGAVEGVSSSPDAA